MTTHEIISATETPMGVILKIRWDNAGDTNEQFYCEQAAKALGYQRPDPQPVDPAWMVEVVQEIMRDERGMTAEEVVISSLRLALSRGHVAPASVMPSEEEMLRGAREDAAQVNDDDFPNCAAQQRAGIRDNWEVRAALQARRNVYASLGAKTQEKSGTITSDLGGKLFEMLPMGEDRHSNEVRECIRTEKGAVAHPAVSSGPVVPEVDLREVAKKAWDAGFDDAVRAVSLLSDGGLEPKRLRDRCRDDYVKITVSAILETLKSGEA